MAEIKYAVIFAELGFEVAIEPPLKNLLDKGGKANPDLQISRDGHSSIVEVKRFRPSDYLGPIILLDDELSESAVLPDFGDHKRDWLKTYDEVETKFRQAGVDGIIAIWNDNGRILPEEVESATYAHLLRGHGDRSSFVLFKSDCVENFYCFKLRHEISAYQEKWMVEFRGVEPRKLLFRPFCRRRGLLHE